jgi:hypothetical protein
MMIWLLMGCRGMETRTNRAPSSFSAPQGRSGGPLVPTPDPSFSPAAPLNGPAFPGTSYRAPQVRPNGAMPVHGTFGSAPVMTPTISLPRTVAPAPQNRWTAPAGSLTAPGEPALFPAGIYRELPSAG